MYMWIKKAFDKIEEEERGNPIRRDPSRAFLCGFLGYVYSLQIFMLQNN